MSHTSVLKNEAIEALQINPDGIYIDATLGRGGHSLSILEQLENGHLFCFDLDLQAIKESKLVLNDYLDKVTFIHDNFAKMGDYVTTPVDGILMDLGVSSPQFDEASRGFSYRFESRLDMRMNQEQELTAYTIVNTWDYSDLVRIFFRYGEEKFSKQIARKIEAHREVKPIETTTELTEIIKSKIPQKFRRTGGHPAKRVFQAIRIAVNDELGVFERSLETAIERLAKHGRVSVITFHSLEDRICKQIFMEYERGPELPKNMPVIPEGYEQPFKRINKKPITANPEDLDENRRARSACLRIGEKLI